MIEICDIAKETIQVLTYFDFEFTSKISKDFLDFLKETAEKSDIIVNIDFNKKLKEQNISEECKDLIALLYYHYFADKTEKNKLVKIWKNNDLIYQKEIEEKFNMNEIFKNKKLNREYIQNSQLPTVVKESLFQKIISFIKKYWNSK